MADRIRRVGGATPDNPYRKRKRKKSSKAIVREKPVEKEVSSPSGDSYIPQRHFPEDQDNYGSKPEFKQIVQQQINRPKEKD